AGTAAWCAEKSTYPNRSGRPPVAGQLTDRVEIVEGCEFELALPPTSPRNGLSTAPAEGRHRRWTRRSSQDPHPLQRDHRLGTSPNSRRGLMTPQTMGCLTLGVLGALRSSAVARSTCVCAEQQHDRGQAVQDNDGRHHVAEDRLGDPTFRTHGTVDRLPTPPRRTRR